MLPDAEWNRWVADEGRRLVEAAREANATLRLIGGAAVVHHAHGAWDAASKRRVADLDAVVAPRQQDELTTALVTLGYAPERHFNALHGDQRMIFRGERVDLDVMVGTFRMCHRLSLETRLSLDSPTVPVTDLLLTKLQIFELTDKDRHDAMVLIGAHELAEGPGDVIDLRYMSTLVQSNWGLWRTIKQNLARLADSSLNSAVEARVGLIGAAIDRGPKSARFRLRSTIGDRWRWYELPEEAR